MSALSTRAPSFARSAPNGLPTTSERLITVITFLHRPSAPDPSFAKRPGTHPRARSPYANNLLYTPTNSSTLTIASGVQGRTDLTVPGGGRSSFAREVGRWDSGMAERVLGEM